MTLRLPSLCALSLLLVGCVYGNTTYGPRLPDEAVLEARIEPGVTTRADLIAWLGPPLEDLRPSLAEDGRADPPAQRIVYEEQDLLTRRHFTWEHEKRRDRAFLFIPFFTIFAYWRQTHLTNRLVVFTDDADVVVDWGYWEELGEE